MYKKNKTIYLGLGNLFNVVNKNKVTIIKIKMRQMQKLYLKSKQIYLDFWVRREDQMKGWTFANLLNQQ